MHIFDLVAAVERIAPPAYAETWDNVGLLIGDGGAKLGGPVLLAIDLTEQVASEAVAARCGAVIAYHPPIFQPLKALNASTAHGRTLLTLIRHGIAVHSPHTALDAAPGGVTDWLADGLLPAVEGSAKPKTPRKHTGSASPTHAYADRRAIVPFADTPFTQQVKLVTFVPEKHAPDVRAALATAGAGLIGEYELCSFATPGTGTFRGKAGTKPAIGKAEQFEEVRELRLEMVCARKALPLALATLRQFHPYEEPAIDVYTLHARPVRDIGAGRRLTLDHGVTIETLADRLKTHLGIPTVKVARAAGLGLKSTIETIGVCPGAGASLAAPAHADGCKLFVTGEMKHHEVMAHLHAGMSVILCGHTASERGYLPRFAAKLEAELPGATFLVSKADRSPFEYR